MFSHANTITKKYILLFTLLAFFTATSPIETHGFNRANICKEALTNPALFPEPYNTKNTKHTEELFSYFTKNLVPDIQNSFQILAFEMYRIYKFGTNNIKLRPDTLGRILNTLSEYPELKKRPFRNYNIIVQESRYPVTERLSNFLNSHLKSSGQIKANLFKIEDNIGYWKKILDYKEPPQFKQYTDKETKKLLREQSRRHFENYLNTELPVSFRISLVDKVPSINSKSKALYYYLLSKRKHLLERNQNIIPISQAIVDLIHTIGFHNKAFTETLKSGDGLDRIDAFKKILEKREDLAQQLNYKSFDDVLDFLGIYGPTGVGNQKRFVEELDELENEVKTSSDVNEYSSLKTVRHLSIMESPYRSCIGGYDCSSNIYLLKALDPNYHYFTLTEGQGFSNGHVTIVLGEAEHNNQTIKVAFIDKVQNIDNSKLAPMLEAIRRSVSEQGYTLAMPTHLDSFAVGIINGITNSLLISNYLENSIKTDDMVFKNFKPHPNSYDFYSGASRAETKPDLKPVSYLSTLEQDNIQPGNINYPWQLDSTFDVEQVVEELSSPNNLSLEAKLAFISATEYLIKNELYNNIKWTKDIIQSWKQNKNEPLELRRKAAIHLNILDLLESFQDET